MRHSSYYSELNRANRNTTKFVKDRVNEFFSEWYAIYGERQKEEMEAEIFDLRVKLREADENRERVILLDR